MQHDKKPVLRQILLFTVCLTVCFAFYRFFAFIAFSQKSRPYFEYSFTHYRGVIAGQYDEYVQKTALTGGQAALAFFMYSIGNKETELSVTAKIKKSAPLSIHDMDIFVRLYGLKTQLLKIKPDYFRKKPAQSILRLKENRYIVFLEDAGSYAVIFDPAYGKVYVPWNRLSKMMSGYMLYVYK
ncbi:MAG: hypothetical protein LBB22_01500 [Treponema sp.]|jgi:ABC-type bacteriocin/lantibiotic exporter with double-glycine peptidase domain|nr:hypothetical protein [Treponema sp.]